jgi:hypothetical protein
LLVVLIAHLLDHARREPAPTDLQVMRPQPWQPNAGVTTDVTRHVWYLTLCTKGNRCIMWLCLVTHQLIITDLVTRRSREQPTYNEAKTSLLAQFHSFLHLSSSSGAGNHFIIACNLHTSKFQLRLQLCMFLLSTLFLSFLYLHLQCLFGIMSMLLFYYHILYITYRYVVFTR